MRKTVKKMYILDFVDVVKHTVKIPMAIDILINRATLTATMKVRCFEQKMFISALKNVN